MDPFLSVVIPAYNEVENFKNGALDQVDSYLRQKKYPWEVIVVDDGSRDLTLALVTEFAKTRKNWRVVKNPHLGKASAVAAGIAKARGNYILFTDFDQATPIDQMEKLLQKAKKGFQVVIGSREVKGAKREKEPFYRHLMGLGFNFFVRLLVIEGIHDTQCGFKLFSRPAANRLFPLLKVYKRKNISDAYTGAFDVELLYLSRKLNFRVAEVGVNWHHVKTNRVNPIKDSIRMFYEIIKIRIYDLGGKYEV